jgi:death-on-curing protein
MPIDFLHLDDVIAIHRDQIQRYGGEMGIRDVGLLESALAQPQAAFEGELLHPDLVAMAAAYLFHVVKNHLFLDGNKRTGAVAAIVFLALNGVDLEADEPGLEAVTLAVARGEAEKEQVAEFFRRISR